MEGQTVPPADRAANKRVVELFGTAGDGPRGLRIFLGYEVIHFLLTFIWTW